MRSLLLFLAAFFIYVPTSQAYFVAVPKDQGAIDYTKNAHILVPGRGTDLGIQPHITALGRATLYKRNFANDQVILISVFEINDFMTAADHEALLLKGGWIILEKNDLTLDTTTVTKELVKFEKIRSLEFFGHNSASRGTQMDGFDHANPYRFDPREQQVLELGPHFTKDAFAIFHGCNSGWMIAQNLSKAWGIAVAGSLTETHFERLHSDGHFYIDTDTEAPNTQWATVNKDLGGISCEFGGCKRMRPEVRRYIGSWGDFNGPLLSHFKFFCQGDVKDCEKRMAMSLYGFVAEKSLTLESTYEDFKLVAKEFLCPLKKDRVITNNCYHQLDLIEKGEGNLNIHYVERNKQLVCTLEGCKATIVCVDEKHHCELSKRVSKDSKTLAEEYLHLLNGFKILQKQGM